MTQQIVRLLARVVELLYDMGHQAHVTYPAISGRVRKMVSANGPNNDSMPSTEPFVSSDASIQGGAPPLTAGPGRLTRNEKGKVIAMPTVDRERAQLYARHRLPYAEQAVLAVLQQLHTAQPVVADVGAGTGLLTRHFVGRAAQIYAIEPEPEMRRILEQSLGDGCISMHGLAEATGLPDQSVDLIVVGNAYHRFAPAATTAEFARILKRDGWLAIFSYGFHDPAYGRGHAELLARFPQWRDRLDRTRHREPATRFFGHGTTSSISVRQTNPERWDEYWGGVLGAMEAPDESDSWFEAFRTAHRELFERCSVNGVWAVPYSTEVVLGQPRYQ